MDRLTDHPDMTIAVYSGSKATKQQQNNRKNYDEIYVLIAKEENQFLYQTLHHILQYMMSGLFSYTLTYVNFMGELQRNSWIILVEGE